MDLKKTKYIWMDGKFKNWKDAKIHLITHTLHYGGGCFEGIRFYDTPDGPAVFRLKDHIKRLFYSSSAIGIKIPFSQKEVCEAIVELLRKNKIKSGYIRPFTYYGEGHMGINPIGAPMNIAIAAWSFPSYLGHEIIRVKTSSYIRIHPKSTVADAKIVGHYSNSILASLEARRAGYDEALFLDYKDNVAEGPGENIFMVKKGIIYTPSVGSILPGFTRDAVMQIAKDLGYKVMEKSFKLKDLLSADEVFMTGTAAEVSPVGVIDKKKIGKGQAGPISEEMKKVYTDAVHGKIKKYQKWLTYI